LHTNFKIDSKGEKIYLFHKNQNTLETVWVKDLTAGWSMGRTTDGATAWGVFLQPTPGLANTTPAYSTERETEPQFSVAEGFYPGKQTISLSTSSPTAEIRYTTDGSEPTITSSKYTGTPASIAVTGLIRATSFSKGNRLPSRTVANSYFITSSGHSVPVLSVITNRTNLYGSTGIFDNTNQEWERPCYVEYFDKDKTKQFEQFSGIQIDGGGGGSRTHPQHSFRLEFDHKAYGEGDVDYPLIPDRPDRKDYKSIYLRNGSNQWLTFPFKDAMECKLTNSNTNNYYSACTPTVVYINGEYFGLYEMREKTNDEFFEENYKATIDSSFHLLSVSYYYDYVLRALNGTADSFTSDYDKFISLNPAATDYLQKADQIIDLDYYTDYIVAQSWIANKDWPFNNIKFAKGDFSNHRWRFITIDLEWSLKPNQWTDSNFDHISYLLKETSGPYIGFWKELMKNQAYKRKFINRFADIMNTSYLPENTQAIAQSIYDDSFSEMRAEYIKWGGGESQATAKMNQYASNLAIFKSELNNRTTTLTHVNKRAVAVERQAVQAVLFNQLSAVFPLVGFAHVVDPGQRFDSGQILVVEALSALDDLLHAAGEFRKILLRQRFREEKIVVEPIADGGTKSEGATGAHLQHRLGHDVGQAVAHLVQVVLGNIVPAVFETGHDRSSSILRIGRALKTKNPGGAASRGLC
jgi:hypothetical protein